MSNLLPVLFSIGDSISVQYGPYLEQYLKGIYQYERLRGESEALRNLNVPTGSNGGDSERVLTLVGGLLQQPDFHPDVLLLNCGLHDIKRSVSQDEIQVPLTTYRSNLEKIVTACRGKGIALVWVRTTPVVDTVHNRENTSFKRYARDLEAYNACADEVMRSGRVPSIDLHTFTRGLGDDDHLFYDHVHYHEDVRQKQGAFLAGCLVGQQLFAGEK